MATTAYYSVRGTLLGEESVSLGRRDYLTDALGSVTATVNQTGVVQNTYRYKPYGGLLARTGTGNDPAFQWVGSQGYRQTARAYSDVYVRARHYSSVLGRWTTRDPIEMRSYAYVGDDPVVTIDPTGNQGNWSYIFTSTNPPFRLTGSCASKPKIVHDPVFEVTRLRGAPLYVGSWIQNLTFTFSATDCEGNPITVFTGLPNNNSSWFEGVYLDGTPSGRTYVADNRLLQNGNPNNTKGKLRIDFRAGWVHGYKVERKAVNPEWDYRPEPEASVSSPDLITRRLPSGASSWFGSFKGYIELRWCCCNGTNKSVDGSAHEGPPSA